MGKLFQPRLPFWERVRRCSHPLPCPQCCWLWSGALDAWGYGRTRRTLYGKVETYAHRIVWIETHGRLPRPGCHPAHTCALPACCNPSHLQERTAAEIQQASVRTGRRAQHPHARKLTPALAAQIRQARQATPRPSQRQLAAQFGITQSVVHAILHEQIWRLTPDQVPGAPPPDPVVPPRASRPSPAQEAPPTAPHHEAPRSAAMSRLPLQRARLLGCCLGLLLLLLSVAPGVHAHRSGCHRWHSCPSDHGTYTCGDRGDCSQCPDNDYCTGGQPRGKAPHPPQSSPTLQPHALPSQDTRVLRLDYEGFTIWLDCAKRGAVKFRYNAQRDQGRFKRQGHFYLDPEVPTHCQQTSTASYKHPQHRYDRGHLVPANHLDNARTAIKQSNYMTNILPQAATMNQGAWVLTEEIVECYRDIDELLVIGGVLWGNNPADDYFVASHGVQTPDAFWKMILRGKDRVMAWIIPNTPEATKKRLDTYLVSVEELEQRTGETFPEVPAFAKTEKPEASWLIPLGCEKG